MGRWPSVCASCRSATRTAARSARDAGRANPFGAWSATRLCHRLFEADERGIPEATQQRLEGLICSVVERSRVTECVIDRVGGIEGQARYPSVRNGRGRRMSALMTEEVWEHMRMGSFWRCLAMSWNALIDLEPCETTDGARCGLSRGMTCISGLSGQRVSGRDHARSWASVSGSAVRTQTSTCAVPSPRSNSTAVRSCGRSASSSGPHSVSTVRRCMALLRPADTASARGSSSRLHALAVHTHRHGAPGSSQCAAPPAR